MNRKSVFSPERADISTSLQNRGLARFSFVREGKLSRKLAADEQDGKKERHQGETGKRESWGKLAEKLFNTESWVSRGGRTKTAIVIATCTASETAIVFVSPSNFPS